MIRLRFLRNIGPFKMVTQMSSAMIFPAVSGEAFGFEKCPSHLLLQKNRIFLSISATAAASLCIHKHPLFRSQKNPLLWDSQPAKFQRKGLFDFGRTWNSCSVLPAYTPNVLTVNRLLNQQRTRSFSTTQAACTDVHVTVMDGKPLRDGYAASRVSRMDRIDAQNALFEYLHGTRGLHFTDAEHMSKNSPVFLQNLIAKVENEPDVGRSLTRFLRYHPINEFEPFFESLGLRPSELSPLLPRNLMFLSDDDVLLENYHALCNYGVPRSKIGKMYKERTEMFRYGYGILLSKLQAYEKLGVTKPTIIKLVTCCPELLIGDVNVEFLRVLEKLKTLGVELDWIRGCFSDKSMYNWSRILEMLNFLDKMGCNKKILARLIKEHPTFIFDDSGKKIYILVAMLLKLGLKMNNILTLFVQYPRILVGNFTKNLWQSVHFLADIGMQTEDIARIVSSHAQVLGSCYCKRPKVVLGSLKISPEELCEIIEEDPSQFSNLASRKKTRVINLPSVDGTFLQEKTSFLLKLGFVENSDEMAKALGKFRGRGDQLQERFDCLVNAGLDYHTVSSMIKLVPSILNQSTDIIEKKIDYLLNHLDYPLEALAVFPTFLCYNTDKIKLRFSMYNWLKGQGIVTPTKNRKMIRSTVALSTILACSDARFVKFFVDIHPEGPKVWERLKISASSS